MAKGPKAKREVLKEDTASEHSRSGDESQPQTATQQEFVTPGQGRESARPQPGRALSPSISSWGYQGPSGQEAVRDYSPTRRTTFGTAQYIPFGMNSPEHKNILSPLPQQIKQPVFMTQPEGRTESKGSPISVLPPLTKGSTSKLMTEGAEDDNDARWIEQVPVEELVPVRGPLIDLAGTKEFYTSVYIEFYATQALHIMMANTEQSAALLNRLAQAWKMGGGYLNKSYRNIARNEQDRLAPEDRALLRPILDNLDDLLRKIDKYSDGRVVGFKVDKRRLISFTQQLDALRKEMEEEFILQGEGMPKLPYWGLEGNANLYWTANDFEILGACYREDVTQFCAKVMNVYWGNKQQVAEHPQFLPEKKERRTLDERAEAPGAQRKLKSRNPFEEAAKPQTERIKSFVNQNASVFGNPSKHTSSQKLSDMLSMKPRFIGSAPDPNDPGGNDDGDDDDGPPGRRNGPSNGRPVGPPRGPPSGRPSGSPPEPPSGPPSGGANADPTGGPRTSKPLVPQFDSKLKTDIIPVWDGDTDELGRWLMKVNRLSERSELVYQQLGYLVPTRLSGSAEQWYYSQSAAVRSRIEEDWGTLKNAIAGYYMNRSYLERQRTRANKARYRQPGHYNETPSEYFIRKLELLEIVYNYSEGELINEIMAGAPLFWSTILAPHLYDSIENFQMAIKFQEDNLLRVGLETNRQRQDTYAQQNRESRNPFFKAQSASSPNQARVNAVGWSKAVSNPPFPKDDANVSPRGTPEDKGGRPCRHCGSGKHWDPECKYARKGERKARVNAISVTAEDVRAQEEYEELYYGLPSDDDEESTEDFQ